MPRPIAAAACSLFLAAIVSPSLGQSADREELPNFAKVEAIVRRHFESLPGHQGGDLISRTQVQPIFTSLELLGWKVKDDAAILNSVLPDSHYVVQQFRTDSGKKFMRKVGSAPLAFDRLDQISRLPGGKLMINDFLRFPNSELTLTEKGPLDVARLARLQPKDKRSGAPAKADLNKATGRIYTVDALIARLNQSHTAEVARRKQDAR